MKQTTRGRKKLNDHIASYTNLVNKLLREISQVSTKGTSFLLEMYYSINDDSQNFLIFHSLFDKNKVALIFLMSLLGDQQAYLQTKVNRLMLLWHLK